MVLGWAGSKVETPQHPEQPGSISTGSAGEFCSLKPLWCLLTRLSKGLVVTGDLRDCAVSAPCGACSALAAHCGVWVAGWMCTVLSAACHSCTLFYMHGAVCALCCTHIPHAVQVQCCAHAGQLVLCTVTGTAARAGCPGSAPRASKPLGAFVEAGLDKHNVKNTSSSSS